MFEVPEVGAGPLRGEVQDPGCTSRIMEVGHWLLEASMEGQDPRRVSGKCPVGTAGAQDSAVWPAGLLSQAPPSLLPLCSQLYCCSYFGGSPASVTAFSSIRAVFSLLWPLPLRISPCCSSSRVTKPKEPLALGRFVQAAVENGKLSNTQPVLKGICQMNEGMCLPSARHLFPR